MLHAQVRLFFPDTQCRGDPFFYILDSEVVKEPGQSGFPEVDNADKEEFAVGDGFGGEAFSFGTVGNASESLILVHLIATDATILFRG